MPLPIHKIQTKCYHPEIINWVLLLKNEKPPKSTDQASNIFSTSVTTRDHIINCSCHKRLCIFLYLNKGKRRGAEEEGGKVPG